MDVSDYVGRQFQRWTVLGPTIVKEKWLCRCECGVIKEVNERNLRAGLSRSCGCLQRETIGNMRRSHGKSLTPIYGSWASMMKRCTNPKARDYRHYGGRGITVCERWHAAANFIEDMEATWFPGATIERDDTNGGYSPENCRWITQAEQCANWRHTVYVDSPWGRLRVVEAARKAGLSYETLRMRVRADWPQEELFKPIAPGLAHANRARKRGLPS